MAGNATLATRPGRDVEERVADLVRVYEAKAYLIYNLALRITCEQDSAMAAAEAAFVGQAAHGATQDALVPAVTIGALGHARRRPRPSGVGDAELYFMRIDAGLPPTERAALALAMLADLGADDIAALLSLAAPAGLELLERAGEAFALAAGVTSDDLESHYRDWGWASPPPELWERVCPSFRQALERAAVMEAATDAPTELLATVTPAPPAPPRRRVRRRALAAAAVVSLGLLAAGVVTATQRGGSSDSATPPTAAALPPATPAAPDPAPVSSSSDTTTDDPVATVQAKRHKPLTPRELDQLRLEELAALRNYQKRETDKRLSSAQRQYAASKVGQLRDLARRRAQIRARERALARRERALARERAESIRRQVAEQDARSEQQRPASAQQPQRSTQPPASDSDPTESQAAQECVQDQDTGQYICPQ